MVLLDLNSDGESHLETHWRSNLLFSSILAKHLSTSHRKARRSHARASRSSAPADRGGIPPSWRNRSARVAPGSGQALPERRRDRLGDVAPMKADLLAQKVARPCFCPDLAGEALELGRPRDKRGQVEAEGLFDRAPLPFPGVALAVGAIAADHRARPRRVAPALGATSPARARAHVRTVRGWTGTR